MTALRELAERWRRQSQCVLALSVVRGAKSECADELLAILDAEGDGGAVDGWIEGYPNHVYASEWFIAETVYNDRVVLRALSEENSYDFTTADHTYMRKENIKRWMQFPDSEFIPSTRSQPVRSGVVSDLVSALKEISEIRWSYAATNGCAHTAAMTAKAALEHFAKSQGESNV